MPSPRRLPYLPGLDGLRALAVAAVLIYHARPDWLPGGFVGVELFFVISGYLITAGLLAEWRDTGSIRLGTFWLRRARRLLPAVFVLIVTTLVICLVFFPNEVGRVRADALASAAYVTNWYLIFDHQPYFEAIGRPSLLQHLWSLAVEEQFYIVWPPILLLCLRLARARGALTVALALAIGSALLMAVLSRSGGDASRLYYGTDTRATGLLLGATLAFVWAPWRVKDSLGGLRRAGIDLLGIGALVTAAALFWFLDESTRFLYEGGLVLVALASVALIAVAVHDRSRLGRLLGVAPLRYIGTRSYSIYLWHWPVFMLTRPRVDVSIDGLDLFALRIAITLLAAEVSYGLVERPIREGALGKLAASFNIARGERGWARSLKLTALTSGVAVLMGLVVGMSAAQSNEPPEYLSVSRLQGILVYPTVDPWTSAVAPLPATDDDTFDPTPTPSPAPEPTPEPEPPSTVVSSVLPSETVERPQRTGPPPVIPTPSPRAVNAQVTAIGDSVMLGAAYQLARVFGVVDMDAEVGRQPSQAIALLQERAANGWLAPTVVIHLGNNGTFPAWAFQSMLDVIGPERQVIVLNVDVARSWEESNNAMLAGMAPYYPNVTLIDWFSASIDQPDYFYDDKVHLKPMGAAAYADLIASYVH